VWLVRGSLHEVAFRPHSFDLVLFVGVLAFWCPFDRFILQRIHGMLRSDGIFFSTLVEYEPVQATLKRRLAVAARPLLRGSLRR
jgi:hypothetical protein